MNHSISSKGNVKPESDHERDSKDEGVCGFCEESYEILPLAMTECTKCEVWYHKWVFFIDFPQSLHKNNIFHFALHFLYIKNIFDNYRKNRLDIDFDVFLKI